MNFVVKIFLNVFEARQRCPNKKTSQQSLIACGWSETYKGGEQSCKDFFTTRQYERLLEWIFGGVTEKNIVFGMYRQCVF